MLLVIRLGSRLRLSGVTLARTSVRASSKRLMDVKMGHTGASIKAARRSCNVVSELNGE